MIIMMDNFDLTYHSQNYVEIYPTRTFGWLLDDYSFLVNNYRNIPLSEMPHKPGLTNNIGCYLYCKRIFYREDNFCAPVIK